VSAVEIQHQLVVGEENLSFDNIVLKQVMVG
jgi:hypothetical protein